MSYTLSVSYPPKEASLVWTVSASKSGSARVRISYLLGNLTKSYNYRAVASHDETTLNLAQYMRMQNLANEQFHDTGLWAGFGPHFHKEIGINETKEVLIEKFAAVPITKTYTCNPAEFNYIDRAQNKLRVPMHYMLKNDAAHGLGKATLEYGKVRIFVEGVGENDKTSTTFLGEDWGKFTPKDDELRLYLGVAQDIVVKRTIERNHMHHVTGNLYRYDAVIKYEIENFKHEPVTLNLVEDARYVRKEIRPDTEREVDWELGKETTFEGGLDKEHSNAERLAFRVNLPAASSDGKAPKVTHKLHLLIKNEW